MGDSRPPHRRLVVRVVRPLLVVGLTEWLLKVCRVVLGVLNEGEHDLVHRVLTEPLLEIGQGDLHFLS